MRSSLNRGWAEFFSVSPIELNHVGAERIGAFHQLHEFNIGFAIRCCLAGQRQKESAESRDRNPFGIIEHRHGNAAAIDDRNGEDSAIGSAGWITRRRKAGGFTIE
jgi:hypothetical protein